MAERNILDPEEQLRQFSQGRMELTNPIYDGDNTVTELKWDFLALSGAEYCDALDKDSKAVNTFRLTNTQALNLFAAAAAKSTGGIDAEDVRRGLNVRDAIKATQLATIFSALRTGWETRLSTKSDGRGHGQQHIHRGAAEPADRTVQRYLRGYP